MSKTPAEEQPGKPPRLPGGRLTYERGIRYSSLPAPSRHLALTIATWADVETGIIPDRFQPAQSTLEEATGLSRGAVFKHLNLLEEEGWLGREVGGGRNKRSRYWLRVPVGAKTGHQVTPFAPDNQSRGDWYPENQSPRARETSHVVNKNQSPGDNKSPLNLHEYLSLDDAPQPTTQKPPAMPTSEREITATPANDRTLTAAQRAVRATAAVSETEEAAFITWITQTHKPRGPAWWRTATADLPELAAAWRAKQAPAAPAVKLRPTGQPCACCGTQAPAACTSNGRPYCANCTAPCQSCQQAVPEDQLHTGQCLTCLPIERRTRAA